VKHIKNILLFFFSLFCDDDHKALNRFLQDEPTGGDGDGGQYHAVELTRGTRGFGFSIRGGREFQNMPLFVLQIAENGPASIDNRLRVSIYSYFARNAMYIQNMM